MSASRPNGAQIEKDWTGADARFEVAEVEGDRVVRGMG